MSNFTSGDELAELIKNSDRENGVTTALKAGDGEDGVTIVVHSRTNRLEVATRWQELCDRCDEPIASGAVGPSIHEDPRYPNGDGVLSYQHGCGERMVPTSEVIDLDQVADAAAEALSLADESSETSFTVEPARGSDYGKDKIPAETIRLGDVTELASDKDDDLSDEDDRLVISPVALAEAAGDAALARLRAMVAQEQREAEAQERYDLGRKLRETRAEYDRLLAEGDEEAAADLLSADDEVRGVGFIPYGSGEFTSELIAWSQRYDQIAIVESDLVGAA
jgi:hypothetical protein